MTQEILNIVWSAVGVLLTGLAGWLSNLLIKWFTSKMKDKEMAKFMSDITTITTNAVKTVFQTYVDSLKKEGAFTAENQKEALAKCLDIIKSQLTPQLSKYIQDNFGDVTNWLTNLIESTIYTLKNKKEA